jgi:hypothetical protein
VTDPAEPLWIFLVLSSGSEMPVEWRAISTRLSHLKQSLFQYAFFGFLLIQIRQQWDFFSAFLKLEIRTSVVNVKSQICPAGSTW